MAGAVRVLQLLLAVIAVLLALAFVMALGSPDTGPLEKVVLLVLAAMCLWGAVALPRLASRRNSRRRLT